MRRLEAVALALLAGTRPPRHHSAEKVVATMEGTLRGSLAVALGGPDRRPTSSCETCRRAELAPLQRLREDLARAVGLTSTETVLRAQASAWTAYRTGWYARHREEYVRTGDPLELARMLRHVQADDDTTTCTGPHYCRGYLLQHCRESCSMCSGSAVRPCVAPHRAG